MKFDSRSQFGIFLPNEYSNNTIIKFKLRGSVEVVTISTTSDKDLYTLPVYDITTPLFLDPTRKLHSENEISV